MSIDIDQIIKKATAALVEAQQPKTLDEAYVAEPKPYRQVTELLSQKTKDAHRSLYAGYVESLNRVSSELDASPRGEADSRHSEFRSLKLDETRNINAVWLHELYFANCFDPHSEVTMDSMAYLRLERDFGTFDDYQKDFIACAMASGDGWAVTGYHMFLKRYVNTFITENSKDVMLGLFPVIVVDMYEHAYYRDYLSDKKSFLIAQMREFNWTTIEERFNRTESISEVIK